MTSAQYPDGESRQRAATLRASLRRHVNGAKIALLGQALMAREVDIRARMLTDLSKKVHQMQTSESEHNGRLLKRIYAIEKDANGLRQLVNEQEREDKEAGRNQDKLNAELTDAIKQQSTEMAEVKQSLEAIKEVVERRQQTDSEVKEGLKMSHEAIKGLQFDKIEIQNVLKKAQSDIAPVVDDVSKLKNRTASFLSQLETLGIKLDQYWATDEDIKITIQNIRSKQDTYEKLLALVAREKEVKDQSTEDRPASSQSSSSQETKNQNRNQNSLQFKRHLPS